MLNSYIGFCYRCSNALGCLAGLVNGKDGEFPREEVAREGWTAVHVWIAFENGGGFVDPLE